MLANHLKSRSADVRVREGFIPSRPNPDFPQVLTCTGAGRSAMTPSRLWAVWPVSSTSPSTPSAAPAERGSFPPGAAGRLYCLFEPSRFAVHLQLAKPCSTLRSASTGHVDTIALHGSAN